MTSSIKNVYLGKLEVRKQWKNPAHQITGGFKKKVYQVVSKIPKGKTLTYREVARLAGSPKAYRAVGNILNKNPYSKDKVPCHRVIRSDGNIGGYASGTNKKKELLQKEKAI